MQSLSQVYFAKTYNSGELNKFHNDICGMRKKMKLKEVKNPTKEEVETWSD